MKYKKKSPDSYFQIKKNIDQLKKLVLEKKEHDYQLKLIKKIIDGVPVTGITISNKQLYRARYNLSNELFKESKDLIYPPSSLAKKGRFNKSKKSIFYAATSELGTIIELRPEINKFFTITEFKHISNELPLFFPLGFTDRFQPQCKLNSNHSPQSAPSWPTVLMEALKH